ncbi:MAG: hypothetical protein RLY86_3820 [Pseudomonadota bacterium]|jgi:RHS repeat-associated protein
MLDDDSSLSDLRLCWRRIKNVFTGDSNRILVALTVTPILVPSDVAPTAGLRRPTTRFTHDGFGRLAILSYPDGASESYANDAADNRTGFIQRDGTVSTTTYDALNRPTGITRPGLPVTVYGLDILGRVVAERAGTGAGAVTVRTHVYDGAGRKQSATVTLPRPTTGVAGAAPVVTMTFSHDAAGNRTGASWSGGSVGWRHDGLNRVTGVDLGSGAGAEAVTRHRYDLLGRRVATARGPATSSYGYDIAGQLTGLSHAWTGGSLTAAYSYDDAGGLIGEALDNPAFLWQPAATQARTTTYDPASPINALTRVDGVVQGYDGRGNRTGQSGGGAAGRTWRYDSRNMLVGASAPGVTASYGWYPEGGRAWKQVNGATTLYLEVDGVEWGSYEADGRLRERTIRATGTGGAVVAVQAAGQAGASSSGGLIRLLPNRQGSVIGWLRPDGRLGGAYTYDAYGNSPQAGAAGPAFRYAGMRYDPEIALYHTPNRAYDPVDGRWMQLDPIGIEDGLNRYAYVRNSPLMGVDPTGLECIPQDDGSTECDPPGYEIGKFTIPPTITSPGYIAPKESGHHVYNAETSTPGSSQELTASIESAVALEHLAGQEQGGPGYLRHGDPGLLQHVVKILDPLEAHGQLGIDHTVYEQRPLDCRGVQLPDRPVRPDGIVGDNVEQDVGIDQGHGSAFAPGQCHDLVGTEAGAGPTAQCGEPAGRTSGIDLDEDDAPIRRQLEIDRAATFDAQPVAHRLGDGDLTLARDRGGHGCPSNTHAETGIT